jgi:NAD(P)-dependent dehydrogenase (short-subunit alcohol dehydrogenase family)
MKTKRAIEAEGRRCLLLPGDVTRRDYCERAIERTVREFGRIDILVSNAAHQTRKKNLRRCTDREFDRTFKTNIYAYFWFAPRRAEAHEARRSDHREQLRDRNSRLQGASGLFGDQRRDQRADEGAAMEVIDQGISA